MNITYYTTYTEVNAQNFVSNTQNTRPKRPKAKETYVKDTAQNFASYLENILNNLRKSNFKDFGDFRDSLHKNSYVKGFIDSIRAQQISGEQLLTGASRLASFASGICATEAISALFKRKVTLLARGLIGASFCWGLAIALTQHNHEFERLEQFHAAGIISAIGVKYLLQK